MERRLFLSALAWTRVLGANDRIRIGLIGAGGRGRYVTKFMTDTGTAEVAALCDVQERLAPEKDYRRLIDNKELDAIVVATPDHWHALPTLAALAAGKPVYVEKPLAHNIEEGKAIVRAAARAKSFLLAGTQQRSAPHYAELTQMVREGLIGEVTLVRVWNYANLTPNGIGRAPDGPVPAGVDWDRYCGPAPLRPFNPKRLGPTYRAFRDYSGGTITDYGVHRFDTVHQIMGDPAGPLRVSAAGGRLLIKDQGDIPDTMSAAFEYDSWLLQYELSNLNAFGHGRLTPGFRYYGQKTANDRPNGEAYHGTKGTIICDRLGYEIWFEGDAQPSRRVNSTDATRRHAEHFLACIRGLEKPRATALTAHRATNIAHLGNLSLDLKRSLTWDPASDSTKDVAPARLGRDARTGYRLPAAE